LDRFLSLYLRPNRGGCVCKNRPTSRHRPWRRYLARADAVKVYEQGIAQRTVVTEFDSVEQAIAAHDSAAYQEALKALGNACERDVRIVGGAD
jgi:uncharacterized protein (DUF1330 family)